MPSTVQYTQHTASKKRECVFVGLDDDEHTQRVSETERKKYKLTHNPNENDHEILSCISV